MGTALSPEWDRWFDEEFTDLVSADDELVEAEFDALIAVHWPAPPSAPPAGALEGVSTARTPPAGDHRPAAEATSDPS